MWNPLVTLFEGRFWNAPAAIAYRSGYMYRAFGGPGADTPAKSSDRGSKGNGWNTRTSTTVVIAGRLAGDLLDPSSWRMSPQLTYPGTPPTLSRRRSERPDHWLEANVVLLDGNIRTIQRVRVDDLNTPGVCAICDLEDDGDIMRYRFTQFSYMPGAQNKFYIVFDEETGLFWASGNIPTDTVHPVPAAVLGQGYRGSPGNERRILMLFYSLDAVNWFQAGCIAMSENPMEAFNYSSMLIDGDDLLVISRTSLGGGNNNALNNHDSNLITFHRVPSFRSYALDLHPRWEP